MKRFALSGIALALVAVMVLVGCNGDGNGEAKPTATQQPAEPTATQEQPAGLPSNYQFSMEWSDSEGSEAVMDFWVKGDKWRTDWTATVEGVDAEMIMIYDGTFAYMYMPGVNQVYKYSVPGDLANPGAQYAAEFEDGYYGAVSDTTMLAGFQAGCSGGASIEGDETVNGVPTTKFKCNFEGGGVSYYWIADSGWLVKGEVTLAGYTYTMEFSDINMNPTISDNIFDIDQVAPGATIMEL